MVHMNERLWIVDGGYSKRAQNGACQNGSPSVGILDQAVFRMKRESLTRVGDRRYRRGTLHLESLAT